MIRMKKSVLLLSVLLLFVIGISAIFVGTHTLKTVNHDGELKLTSHGMTTALSLNQSNKTQITTSEERAMIRISFKTIDPNFYQSLYRKFKKIGDVKEVYRYLMVKNEYGTILGIDVDKDFLFITEEVSVIPRSIEGRLLTEEDDGEFVMMVNETFAKNNKTKEGQTILGRLSYHPKAFQLGENEVSVVGIVSPVSNDKNMMIMPLKTAEKLPANNKERPNYELYIWVNDKEKVDKVVQMIKKEMVDLNGFQIQVVENETTKLFHH